MDFWAILGHFFGRFFNPYEFPHRVPKDDSTEPWDGGKDGCDVVYDDVWEEKCKTTYEDTKCWDEKDR